MDPFLGQITLFACNFAPQNWAMCQGQLLPISQYSALFSLLGTNFGGDGRVTFGLPDLRGRLPNGQGTGPGLSTYVIGEIGGTETVSLTSSTIPQHTHALPAYTADASTKSPAGALPAKGQTTGGRGAEKAMTMYNTGSPSVALTAQQVAPVTGGGVPHTNIQPSLALNWCIAMTGVFTARP
jgi:microcystin-dependent protein